MATPIRDLTGQRIGKLLVIRNTGERFVRKSGRKYGYIWECKCDCGNVIFRESSFLTSGKIKSCGCYHSQVVSKNMSKGNLEGLTFGKLKILRRIPINERNPKYKYYPYLCQCDCGNITYAKTNELTTGNKVSCGCVHEEYSKKHQETAKTHGKSDTRLYKVWSAIKGRCFNHNNKNYDDYGGRGITICDEWLDFNSFWEWAYANGYDENAPRGQCTLDRIDNDKGYSPDNCRWVDAKVQRINQRKIKKYEYKGEYKTITEWSKELDISYNKLKYGIENKNLTIEMFLKKCTNK